MRFDDPRPRPLSGLEMNSTGNQDQHAKWIVSPVEAREYISASAIGMSAEGEPLLVTPEAIMRFAEATADSDPETRLGRRAPLFLDAVVGRSALVQLVTNVVPPNVLVRAMHRGYRLVRHHALHVGDSARARAVVVAARAAFSGTLVTARVEVDEGSRVVSEQWWSLAVHGGRIPNPLGEMPQFSDGADAEPFPDMRVTKFRLEDDVHLRYAAASGDNSPIHIDEGAARLLGLPGVVVPGMATLAIALNRVAEALPPLAEADLVAASFTRPVHPGQSLGVVLQRHPALHDYRFKITDDEGRSVLKQGVLRYS